MGPGKHLTHTSPSDPLPGLGFVTQSGGHMSWREQEAELGRRILFAESETSPWEAGSQSSSANPSPILLENTPSVLEGDPSFLQWEQPWGSCPTSCPAHPPSSVVPRTPVWPSRSLSRDWSLHKGLQSRRKRPEDTPAWRRGFLVSAASSHALETPGSRPSAAWSLVVLLVP